MSLASLLLGIWLILLGLTWMGVISLSSNFLGIVALVTGILWLLEGYHPITVFRRGPTA